MESLSKKEIQELVFAEVAAKHSEHLTLKVTIGSGSEAELDDLRILYEKGFIKWLASLKANPYMTPVSNSSELITAVVYYGDPIEKYACIGYAIGCINAEGTALEITHMEKRKDAGNEWCSKFLPLIVDAYTSYGLLMNTLGATKINKLALVGPLPGVKKYYKESGFEYTADYLDTDAMISFLKTID